FSRKTAQLLRLSLLIIGFAALIMAFFSDFLINTMFGHQFEESALILQTLAPGVVILTLFKVMNMDLAGKGKPWVSLKAMIPSLVINIGLNILLVPTKGAFGAAIASTVSYTIAAILFIFFYSRTVKLSIAEVICYKKTDINPIIDVIKKVRKR